MPTKKSGGLALNAEARSMFTEAIVAVVERNIGKYLRSGRKVVSD